MRTFLIAIVSLSAALVAAGLANAACVGTTCVDVYQYGDDGATVIAYDYSGGTYTGAGATAYADGTVTTAAAGASRYDGSSYASASAGYNEYAGYYEQAWASAGAWSFVGGAGSGVYHWDGFGFTYDYGYVGASTPAGGEAAWIGVFDNGGGPAPAVCHGGLTGAGCVP